MLFKAPYEHKAAFNVQDGNLVYKRSYPTPPFNIENMRIIGYIEHPTLKISIFKLSGRFAVKFESGLYEQTYKFRESEYMTGVDAVRQLVDAELLTFVEQEMQKMHQQAMAALSRVLPPIEAEEFDRII